MTIMKMKYIFENEEKENRILQDHLEDKKFSISGKGVKDNTLDAIIKEIEKCEIVCANCHRHRTYMRSADKPMSPSSSG